MAHKHIGAVICLLNISAKCIKEYTVCLQLVMLGGVNALFTAVRGGQTCGITKANPVKQYVLQYCICFRQTQPLH